MGRAGLVQLAAAVGSWQLALGPQPPVSGKEECLKPGSTRTSERDLYHSK